MNRVILFFCVFLVASEVLAQGNEITVMKKRASASSAITFDTAKAVQSSTFGTTTPALSFTVTIGSAANNYVLVGFGCYADNGTYAMLDSIYVDGTGGGKIALIDSIADHNNDNPKCGMFGIKNVQAGLRTFTAYGHGTNGRMTFGVVSLSGVHQTTPTGTVAKWVATDGNNTASITNTTGKWVIDVVAGLSATYTCAATQTLAWQKIVNPKTSMSYKSATGTTVSWTNAYEWNSMMAIIVNPID
jgi:hypothetical protein